MAITTRDAFVDEEPLGEAPPKTVTRDVAEVVVPSSVGNCLGGAPDDRPAATGIRSSTPIEPHDSRWGHLDTTPVLFCLFITRCVALWISVCIINSPQISV